MSKFLYEITTIIGEYEKDGEKKNRYFRVGSVIETKNGMMIKIDGIPTKEGGWDGWCYCNEPRSKEHKSAPASGFDDISF
jgi:hypothetical protein